MKDVLHGMDPLGFLSDNELTRFFHCKKTEMSCMENPHTFLNQLRDHNLLPEDQYKKVIETKSKSRMQEGVYQMLDRLEKEGRQRVRLFWICVFKNHILQNYPVFRSLRNSLLDGSFKVYEQFPDAEELNKNEPDSSQSKQRADGQMCGRKRKKSTEGTEEREEPCSSSCSNRDQNKAAAPLIKKQKAGQSQLDVTCGDKQGTLYRDKLAKGYKCIQTEGRWFTASEFVRFAIKGNGRNWRQSICCFNTPLQTLIEEGHLQSPGAKRTEYTPKNQNAELPVSSLEDFNPLSSYWCPLEFVSTGIEAEGSQEDLSKLSSLAFPVDCGSLSGVLDESRFTEEKLYIWTWKCYKTKLPVICGYQEGTLYRDILAEGYKCILSQGRWFTAREFAQFAVKGKDEDWRQSICCLNTPLQTLIEGGHLLPVDAKMCNQKIRNMFPVGSLEAPRTQCVSTGTQIEGPRGDHTAGSKIKQEKVEEEEDGKAADLSKLGSSALPVSCGSLSGVLDESSSSDEKLDIWTWNCYKSKLPVTCSDQEGTLYRDKLTKGYKCIQTEGRWFTASEFTRFAVKGNGRNWRQSICCLRTPLQTLIEEGHLQPPGAKMYHQKDKKILFPVSSLEAPVPPLPLIKEEKLDVCMWDRYKSKLPVTCGDQEGTLYRAKLAKGYKCILSQGRWFTAREFAQFAVKGKDEDWRQSICCLNTPLQTLIEGGHLLPVDAKRPDDQKNLKIQPDSFWEAPSPALELESDSSLDSDGSSEDHEEEEEMEEEEKEGKEVDEMEEEEEEENGKTADLSKSGSCSKSIHTEERWFLKQEFPLTDGHWDKDILCHDKPHDYLLKVTPDARPCYQTSLDPDAVPSGVLKRRTCSL